MVAVAVEMSSIKLNCLLCFVIICVLVRANTQSVHRRFEYKYSFKPPYLAQKDGTVPFWEYGGSEYFIIFTCYFVISKLANTLNVQTLL